MLLFNITALNRGIGRTTVTGSSHTAGLLGTRPSSLNNVLLR